MKKTFSKNIFFSNINNINKLSKEEKESHLFLQILKLTFTFWPRDIFLQKNHFPSLSFPPFSFLLFAAAADWARQIRLLSLPPPPQIERGKERGAIHQSGLPRFFCGKSECVRFSPIPHQIEWKIHAKRERKGPFFRSELMKAATLLTFFSPLFSLLDKLSINFAAIACTNI